MKFFKFLNLIVILYSTSLFATPQFAREQQVNCSACHTNIPMLNKTGQSFLRNGFRFSSEDKTSLKKFLYLDKNDSRHIPIAIMLRENYSTNNYISSQKVKLYAGGSITKNLSFFALTKKSFNTSKGKNVPNFFEEKTSRAYFQLNSQENKHVLRVGLISPFTQFGNIQKAFSDSEIKGGKYYKTPKKKASFSNIKGAEYSYLLRNKWLFLFSYGKTIMNREQFISGVKYSTDTDLNIGIMFNKLKDNKQYDYSLLFPIEKIYNDFILNTVFVYKNSKNINSYYGMENSLVYTINDSSNIRAILNLDKDSKNNKSYSYALSYTKLFKSRWMLRIAAIKIDSITKDNDYINTSFSLYF